MLALLANAAINVSLALIVGAWLSAPWLSAPGSTSGRALWPSWVVRTMDRTLGIAALAALLASVWALLLEARVMADAPLSQALAILPTVLLSTHYGHAWLAGSACLLMLVLLAWQRSPLTRQASLALIALYALSRSTLSHAGALGVFSAAVAIDWMHLLCISAWVGEIALAALVLGVPAAMHEAGLQARSRYIEHLSASATWMLCGIVLTGVFSSVREVPSLTAAQGSRYLWVLGIKLCLVTAAALLAAWNRYCVMPDVSEPAPNTAPAARALALRYFHGVLLLEGLSLLAALASATLLAATAPPPHN